SQVSSQFVLTFPVGFDDRVTSLRQLLMRWFGYKDEVEQDSGVALSEEYDNDSDDVVDRLETLPEQKNSKNADSQVIGKLTESDRRRALKILAMVTEQMSSETYMLERQPEAISVDIQFASVLFRSALCENWITEEEFFESTHKIWSGMFLTSPYNSSCGWLEYRFLTSKDQGEFLKKLVSPKLSAALTVWALAIPDEIFSINQLKFSLSRILSVARLRWLWENDNRDEVDKELQELLVSSLNKHSDHFWDDFQARWINMIRNGNAVRILEKKLSVKTPGELKDQISQKEVKRGDLLWQGINGFCVATEDFMRGEKNTPILYLQRNKKDNINEEKIRSAYAIPIKSVIIERIIDLDEAPSNYLLSMLNNLEI
ncbi:hypothetical protein HGB13_04540, partial [bacterium]|nr:hypothetical protein [bacterium]